MRKYDLHIHSNKSSCSVLKPETILTAAKKLRLDGIAVTDHNTIKGAKIVSKLNKDPDFEVIIGAEFGTDKAHVLGLYLNDDIKTNDFYEVLDQIRSQDGIAIIAHPFSYLRSYFKADIKYMDCIESYNGRAFFFENWKAAKLAKKLNLSKVAGSDAHFPPEIGRGLTMFDHDLRQSIKKKMTVVSGRQTVNLICPFLSFLKNRI
ncbi:MAG: PHP domain-containing protein [Nanoarchaeota archaeon]